MLSCVFGQTFSTGLRSGTTSTTVAASSTSSLVDAFRSRFGESMKSSQSDRRLVEKPRECVLSRSSGSCISVARWRLATWLQYLSEPGRNRDQMAIFCAQTHPHMGWRQTLNSLTRALYPHILILSRDQPPPRPATFTRSSHGRYCTSIPRPCCLMTAMVEALDRAPATTPACRPPCARGALARPATSTACPAGCSAPQQRTNRARLLRPTLGISAVTAPGLPLSLLLLLLEVRTRRSHRWWDWRRRPPA